MMPTDTPLFAGIIKYYEEELRSKFPTYRDAIAELLRLQLEHNPSEMKRTKKPKGRPPTLKVFGVPVSLIDQDNPKKERGRPRKATSAEMMMIIDRFESLKDIAEKSDKLGKRLTDKQLIRLFILWAHEQLRHDKKKAAVEKISKQLKYYREETGLRQRKSGKSKK